MLAADSGGTQSSLFRALSPADRRTLLPIRDTLIQIASSRSTLTLVVMHHIEMGHTMAKPSIQRATILLRIDWLSGLFGALLW